jgi:antitoxin StbD
MRQILADYSVSISELKKNPSAVLTQASGSPVAVLNHNKPAAYLIPAETIQDLFVYVLAVGKREKGKIAALRKRS